MNKSLIVSIGRKYLGLMLVVGSLLLIASSNTSYPTAPTAHGGSVVTFLTPKPPSPSNSNKVANNSDVSTTTTSNATSADVSTSTSVRTNLTTTGSATTTQSQSTTSPPPSAPSDTYVPPANDDPELYTPPYSRCGSCRPMYDKAGPQRACPQYMACVY
jgi:hypothetical protein